MQIYGNIPQLTENPWCSPLPAGILIDKYIRIEKNCQLAIAKCTNAQGNE